MARNKDGSRLPEGARIVVEQVSSHEGASVTGYSNRRFGALAAGGAIVITSGLASIIGGAAPALAADAPGHAHSSHDGGSSGTKTQPGKDLNQTWGQSHDQTSGDDNSESDQLNQQFGPSVGDDNGDSGGNSHHETQSPSNSESSSDTGNELNQTWGKSDQQDSNSPNSEAPSSAPTTSDPTTEAPTTDAPTSVQTAPPSAPTQHPVLPTNLTKPSSKSAPTSAPVLPTKTNSPKETAVGGGLAPKAVTPTAKNDGMGDSTPKDSPTAQPSPTHTTPARIHSVAPKTMSPAEREQQDLDRAHARVKPVTQPEKLPASPPAVKNVPAVQVDPVAPVHHKVVSKPETQANYYVIQPGDTLTRIAQIYHHHTQASQRDFFNQVVRSNSHILNKSNLNLIPVWSVLKVPGGEFHIVKPHETVNVSVGGTLWKIAQSRGYTDTNEKFAEFVGYAVAENPELHGNPGLILPGQQLKVLTNPLS